ncbi:GyrI-like domain-containing protein [Flavobacteriaceae bacterium TP-CH-4]|uniref:GyrI-like domain-containing protein n=1 Tax=Pelagihabitans pacificus TaxID=2696054 RepID=A0A967AUM9_9FLAO|nr:GyrI-like domain-containing protein [Pelagihabitans pacificus]NHF60309.1 GyrI-like domain-containing protein [Pelagihabitans pacificus]
MPSEPRLELLSSKKLVGKSVRMSLIENRTRELWNGFMKDVVGENSITTTTRYSVQLYDLGYFKNFDPHNTFTKWACMEADKLQNIPNGFEIFDLPAGLYAVFDFKGLSSDFPKMAQFIYNHWLPNSDYEPDHRPHFELLGEKYRNNHPDSEEEVWVPIKRKEVSKNH